MLLFWRAVNLQMNRTVKYQGAFSRIVGFAGKRFLFSPPHPPSTFFLLPLSVTFANNSIGNACYAGYSCSCQLTTTWMCNIRLQAPTLARLWNFTLVALWCRRTDGYVTIKISLTDRYSYFLSCGAPLTRVELGYNLAVTAGGSEITA